MAGVNIQSQYANQQFDEQDIITEDAPRGDGVDYGEGDAVRQLPWMAVALALHGVLAVVFALIVTGMVEKPQQEVLKAFVDQNVMPPIPEPEVKPEVIFPKDDQLVPDPTIDPCITPTPIDDHNEDPTDDPFHEKAPNPYNDDSKADSPSPYKGPVSSMGLAGGGGGGSPKGGRGGQNPFGARGGGGPPHQPRIMAGLQWLADHQNVQGYWSSKHFKDDSVRIRKGAATTGNVDFKVGVDDGGWDSVDVGLTGLSLLAFAGDGHTHRDGKYRDAVIRGLKWMRSIQDADGLFGKKLGEEYVYNHALCCMAVCEIYGLTDDAFLKDSAQRSVNWIINAQNPGLGWRYDVKPGDNDSSVTAWMVLALKSAKMAGLTFPESTYAGANNWYDKVSKTDKGTTGGSPVTGYDSPEVNCARLKEAQDYLDTPSMDACCVMVRLFTHNKKPGDRDVAGQAKRMNTPSTQHCASTPAWNPDDPNSVYGLDFYYWYYASLALFQMGDNHWKDWEKAIFRPVLLKHQRGWHPKDIAKFGVEVSKVSDGSDDGRWRLDEQGSWDPVDAWGTAGGRVYATAINTLTLEVYERYLRINK